MKNSIGAAVLLPLVTSLIAILIGIGNFYFIDKTNAVNKNRNLPYDNFKMDYEAMGALEERTFRLKFATCVELNVLLQQEDAN